MQLIRKNKKTIFCLVTLSFLSYFYVLTANKAQAYDPPIGIPDPGMWGTVHPIDSSAPDTAIKCPAWPSAESNNCYYIDSTHPNATNLDNDYGYPDKPRARIPGSGTTATSTHTYTAGAYVQVHGGPYTERMWFKMEGTENDVVWFRGTPESMPNIQEKVTVRDSTYTIFEYLDFNSHRGSVFGVGGMASNNVCMRNSRIHDLPPLPLGSEGSAMGASPDQGGVVHDVIFYNNNFSDIGDWQVTSDEDFHGIAPGLWGDTPPTTMYNFWVLNNTGYHISGNLVQFNGDQRDAKRGDSETPIRLITNTTMQKLHHLYVGKNIHHHNRQSLASLKFSTDSVVSQNTSYANYSTSSGGASGQVYQEGANYAWFLFNDYRDSDWGVRQSNTNFDTPNQDLLYGDHWAERTADLHVFAIGNKISHIYDTLSNSYYSKSHRDDPFQNATAFLSQRGFYTRYIVDNTIYNVGGGFYFANNDSSTYLSGNVIAGVQGIDTEGLPMYHGGFFQAGNNMAMDYSFFEPRNDDGTVRFLWFSPDAVRTTTLDLFKSRTGECNHCHEGNPLFVDPENYNLRPQASSPLIGKGVRHEVYDIFEQRYGISIDVDFDGNPRPTSGAWTIGAFEYQNKNRADVDNSSQINTTDALLTLRNSLGLSMNGTAWQASATTGDVNCDGVSNSTDALLILRYSLGLSMSETGWCE